jgi:NAD-dependent deacetylase
MRNIVVLTGAGISAESGINTFRSSDGLWERHRIDDVATPEGYHRNPELVQAFYNERRRQLQQVSVAPNPAHYALATLERCDDVNLTLVTQNIDNLHERAGSRSVVHMHGELLKARCPQTYQTVNWVDDLSELNMCHCCQLPSSLRPHIVWFGEMPLELDRIYAALTTADMFIAIGTSGNVYPAAGFVQEALSYGAKTVELNLEAANNGSQFELKRYGRASELVPQFVREILSDLA